MNGQHDDHASDRTDPERERIEADQNRNNQREATREFYPGNHGFQEGAHTPAVSSPQSPTGEGQRYGQTHAAHGYYEPTSPRYEQGSGARYEQGHDARYDQGGSARYEQSRSGQNEGADARYGHGSASYEPGGGRYGPRALEPRQHERQSFEHGQPGYGYEAGRWNRGDSAPGQYERDADDQFARRPFDPGHAPQRHDQRTNWSQQSRSGQEPYRGASDPYRGGRDDYESRNRLHQHPDHRVRPFGPGEDLYGEGWSGSHPHSRAEGLPQHPRARRRYPMGPKGYQRSDARLREDISERLMQTYDIDSSEVTVEVQGGKVILEGTVPDRYMKHAIEDLADAAPGVQDIENRIRVAPHPAARDTLAESAVALGSPRRENQASGPSGSNTSSASAAGSGSAAPAASATSNMPESAAGASASANGKSAKRD